MRRILIPAILVALTAGAGWWATREPAATVGWRTATVTRRDVQRLVSATGTLAADPTVDVGTQVSGIIAELLVDFNARVAKGQVLARIDTSLLDADVAAASARLAEAHAQRDRLRVERERTNRLHGRDAASDEAVDAAAADVAVADAQARAASVALRRARRNLAYATIRAPIDGTVIRRDVAVGQTVNAGFSAPTLFAIASDLSRMTILANVDESDVGSVKEGQTVRFTVPSWPDRTFEGKVRQVRLGAKVEQGVVTYTVVVDADNADGALFPGMTATTEFIVAEVKDAFCAPNAALRFSPEADQAVVGERPAPLKGRTRGAGGPGSLWVPEGAALRALAVTVGLRGAECTEVSGDGLSEGLEVVLGVERAAAASGGNPLAPGAGRSAGGPRR